MNTTGDFTADRRLITISVIGIAIGVLCAFVAAGLLKLVGFFTNLFYFGRISGELTSPAGNHLGIWAILVPPLGGLIIGLMARYGSDRIRGHGIPEAIEAILIGGSRMDPKVAVLKPLSSAISIGSGGPFGAEGPIIMTGGAFGSIIAQVFHLTASERKCLLVAGAAGGMSATFGTPVAAVLLAVELLLFEWKPRSLVPVALASVVAAFLRPAIIGPGPLFPLATHPHVDLSVLLGCALVGLAAGMASSALTWGVYAAEDSFQRLSIHWMWWPALGGVAVGLGGLAAPRALGVGYDVIHDLLQNGIAVRALAVLLIIKAVIWIVSLGSGTSGGVLAPLLIIGGALGALEAPFLPRAGSEMWPLISMATMLGGTMRSPLTAIVFALELTHDADALLPLLIASVAGYAFTVLVMKRSILTEKVARRGYHLTREYSVDPLEIAVLGDVMSREVETVPGTLRARDLERLFFDPGRGGMHHQGYPVVDDGGLLAGVVTRSNVIDRRTPAGTEGLTVADLISGTTVTAFEDETCRSAAERMAHFGVGRLPVVERRNPRRIVGIVTLSDLLKARHRYLELESRRERVLRPRWRRSGAEHPADAPIAQ